MLFVGELPDGRENRHASPSNASRKAAYPTGYADQIKAGDAIEVKPPAGHFTPHSIDSDFLLFAGGSGITPIFSIIRSALIAGRGRLYLIYANRDERVGDLPPPIEGARE